MGGGAGTTGGSGGSGGSGGLTGGSGGAPGGTGGLPEDWLACAEPTECQLVENDCCGGYCFEHPLSDYTAINGKHIGDLSGLICSEPVACPGCAGLWSHPNYTALCRDGRCSAVDVRNDELSQCVTDADCRLRWGASCCESCGAGAVDQLTALSLLVNLDAALCGSAGGCPLDCVPPPYPAEAIAYCGQNGHCAIKVAFGGP
jgi:hypothetical protein